MTLPKTLLEALEDKFTVSDGCWLWAGSTLRSGYGQLRRDGANLYAHRVIYELLIGPIPAGMDLDHLCRNRACVRPDHLEPVTNQVNVLRGEGPTAINARKTHCLRGHEFTPENTYANSAGAHTRSCRTCALKRAYQSKQRRKRA